MPELANVQIRAATESASSVLHTFLDFATYSHPCSIIKRCSDYLKNDLEDVKDGIVTIVGGVAVVSDGENHAVRPFLHAFKTVVAMFQVR